MPAQTDHAFVRIQAHPGRVLLACVAAWAMPCSADEQSQDMSLVVPKYVTGVSIAITRGLEAKPCDVIPAGANHNPNWAPEGFQGL